MHNTNTDQNGSFKITGLAPGDYYYIVSRKHFHKHLFPAMLNHGGKIRASQTDPES